MNNDFGVVVVSWILIASKGKRHKKITLEL